MQSLDFQILLFAYSFDGEPVKIIDLAQEELLPMELVEDLQNPNVIKHKPDFLKIVTDIMGYPIAWAPGLLL